MARKGMAAYIITGSDAHMSEYVPERWMTRQWLSGFTGSAGTLVVTAGKAGLWTDSRYFIQAAAQIKGTGIELYRAGLPGSLSVHDFLTGELSAGYVAGVDGKSFSAADARTLNNVLSGAGIRLDASADLFDEIWDDRPGLPGRESYNMHEDIAGRTVKDKLEDIAGRLRHDGADAVLLCALDEVAWTFNIRGYDVEYTPLVMAYAFVSEKASVIFISPGKLDSETKDNLTCAGVRIEDYDSITRYLPGLSEGLRLEVDMKKTSAALFNAIPQHCRIVEGVTAVGHLKSIKNVVELDGFRNATELDGLAMTRLFIWLENGLRAGSRPTETDVARELSNFRARCRHYLSDSFRSIVGYAAHGAVVHYSATEETDAVIRPEGLLLIDSGAQYLYGTTDMTRTVSLDENPSEEAKRDFTLVLKGHISLARCKFPAGTRGSQLDAFARKALWDAGMDYGHGTGHGIGHCLCVHEGPQSIRREENPAELLPGMVLSNEPGLYREGRYGIRIENMMTVCKDCETDFGTFLRFETLTLCPIDTRLIIVSMLTGGEREWLNNYHRMVLEKLSPALDEEEQRWLRIKTQLI